MCTSHCSDRIGFTRPNTGVLVRADANDLLVRVAGRLGEIVRTVVSYVCELFLLVMKIEVKKNRRFAAIFGCFRQF